jgi:hypothetical protein
MLHNPECNTTLTLAGTGLLRRTGLGLLRPPTRAGGLRAPALPGGERERRRGGLRP